MLADAFDECHIFSMLGEWRNGADFTLGRFEKFKVLSKTRREQKIAARHMFDM
jgi:hypothetical protein